MTIRSLGTVLALVLCAACATVDSGPPTPTSTTAPSPLPAAEAGPAVVDTEEIITPLSDGKSKYVCYYWVPTGTRIREITCQSTKTLAEGRSAAKQTTERMSQGVTVRHSIVDDFH